MSGPFLSDSHLAAARTRAAKGEQPWAEAYRALVVAADRAMDQAPLSIRQNGGSPWFRQDGAYVAGRDGVRNPEANHRSSQLARQLGSKCLDLALAWRLTGENRYAEKAVGLIHTWCINRDTYMFPSGAVIDAATPGGVFGGDITIFGAFHDLFLSMHLLRDFSGWALRARAGVKRWVRAMIDAQREVMFYDGREMFNNWEDARLLYLAKGALALDDLDLLIQVFDRWRVILPIKMTDEGELPRETMRTRSMHYTLFALSSTVQVAEIARQLGENLHDLVIDGRCLKKAVDYAAHHLLHMDEWPFEMIEPLSTEHGDVRHLGLFETVHSWWGDERYLEVIAAWGGRPVTAGHATLLYGA